MTRAKKSIGRYSRQTILRRASASGGSTNNSSALSLKRKWTKTPIKSPFKSPLYKAHQYSPERKKIKAARPLFDTPNELEEQSLEETELHSSTKDSNCESDSINKSDLKSDEALSSNSQTLISLVPTVMANLSNRDGMDSVIVNFFEMVANNAFPLDNIAFLLWIEVVKWFSCESTTHMRYSDQTKLFWKLGWRLFGTRFLNYMGGFKSHGELVLELTEKGHFTPDSSEINFAVPNANVLRRFDPYENKGERKPGIYDDTLCMLSENLPNLSACLTFDGKKLKQGLTPDSGDVDLFGHEKGLSLSERKTLLENDIREIVDCEKRLIESFDSDKGLNSEDKYELVVVLMNSLSKVSMKVNEMTALKERKEYCKQKLIERSGVSDWKKGRLSFAISSVIAFIHEIDEFVKNANTITADICKTVAQLNNGQFVTSRQINLNTHERYASVEIQKTREEDVVSTRLIKQRSNEWHEIRSKALVTGSTLFKAVGCDGLGNQKNHFEKVVCGIEEKEPSDFAKMTMKHGTDNEPNAIGTIVGVILPVLTPELIFCEEGCSAVKDEKGDIFMVVSPDGSLRTNMSLDSSKMAVEIKCPVRKVHTSFPDRYLLQCLAEMFVLDVKELLYVSWTEEITTVFIVSRNDCLLSRAMDICVGLFGAEKPKKPTKLTDATKQLKEEIHNECKNVKFIGRFPSLIVGDTLHTFETETASVESLCQLLSNVSMCYRNSYELQRERATEAVVFLVADLDRSWKKDNIRCSPVGWFPKGYSLDTETMREIAEQVHTACYEKGIHVPCESFDGQWHLLVVRDTDGSPLTALQLQKDVWKSVEKMSKKEIVDTFKEMNKDVTKLYVTEVDITGNSRTSIIATNGGVLLPSYRHVSSKGKDVEQQSDNTDKEPSTLIEVVPDIVRETADVGLDVMAMTQITDAIEMEAFSHNTDSMEWCRELQMTPSCESTTLVDRDVNAVDLLEPNEESLLMESKLDLKDMNCILSLLKTTKDCNKKLQWNDVTPQTFNEYFSSYESLKKLLDVEIRVVVRYLKKTKQMTNVKESSSKKSKIDCIAKFLALGIPESTMNNKVVKQSQKRCLSLRDLCTKVVTKYSKQDLNVMLAEYIFPNRYRTWIAGVDDITIDNKQHQWFYKPAYSKSRKQFEVKCIDSTHLLTRARRKTCAGGIEGMTNQAWSKVAKTKSTLLTPIMVEEITDPMSVSMAKTHFSESVESEMRTNGDIAAAELVSDIRNWWNSEDTPGISASQRIEMRLPLRRRLLSYVDFSRFPPQTQYMNGWPMQLWEALIANFDAKAYLYSMVHGGTYNVRAFSSLIGETFFSELTLNDKRGQGTVSALEFGQFIGNATEQVNARLDNERKFAFCTSKIKVYSTVDESGSETKHTTEECRICQNQKDVLPQAIRSRDHPFDRMERKRLPGRQKRSHIPTERGALLQGSLGVRWEKARCNMAKMLPTKRMGIPDD